ncbi:uncharacterized protein DSM5745_05774 [Aspergillus mulundensis]|uniref:DUF7580 domain-containing protein n=1 Tax=Aspergillus mulundensis TaxID=1810919 RepID=A0A3D8RXZ3_9EURO|nr:Uncharacterized protein DSM5745_05774 [Aspergillus mulundensis]RDW78922.1 Uncharacterized protein DSM5745_05774 [Aspergillus mulundensis]
MSGLEIVGVVLGAIPITIAAIELYQERQTRIAFRNKKPYVLRLIQALKEQHYLLKSDIQLTLNGAGVEYNNPAHQPVGAMLRDPAVANAVKDYLGDDSEIYFGAVNACYIALARLVGRIQGLGAVTDLENLVRTYTGSALPEKIRFSVKRDELEKQIWYLNMATTSLRRISDNMVALKIQVAIDSSSRQIARFASALGTVRDYAKRLYSAVSAAYPGPCHAHHEARLFLCSRSNLMDRTTNATRRRNFSFTVLLSPAMSTSTLTASYRTDIKVAEVGEAPTGHIGNTGRTRVVIRPPTPPATAAPLRSAMDDLCKGIQRARDGGIMLDLQVSETNCLTYCYQQGPSASCSVHLEVESTGFVTLERLLAKTERQWLLNHRIALSLTIASSLLQLISTPWLQLPLTSRTVRFSKSGVDVAALDFSMIPEPFVEELFHKPTTGTVGNARVGVRDCMLELGILLLGIAHWRTMDDYANERTNDGQPAARSRYGLANGWTDASTYLILPFQRDVIRRCVDCTFATSGPSLEWDDVVLRKSIAEYVLKPLQENCPQQLR